MDFFSHFFHEEPNLLPGRVEESRLPLRIMFLLERRGEGRGVYFKPPPPFGPARLYCHYAMIEQLNLFVNTAT